MKKRIAFVMDDILTINPKKDTTLALIEAAQQRHWEVYYLAQQALTIKAGKLVAAAQPVKKSA